MTFCRDLNMSPRELDESDIQDVADWATVLRYQALMAPKQPPPEQRHRIG